MCSSDLHTLLMNRVSGRAISPGSNQHRGIMFPAPFLSLWRRKWIVNDTNTRDQLTKDPGLGKHHQELYEKNKSGKSSILLYLHLISNSVDGLVSL